jgi:hypothetical protein
MSSVSRSVLFGALLSFTDFGCLQHIPSLQRYTPVIYYNAFRLCHVHSNTEYFDKHGCVRQTRFANQLVAHDIHAVTRCPLQHSRVLLVTWIQRTVEGNTSSPVHVLGWMS